MAEQVTRQDIERLAAENNEQADAVKAVADRLLPSIARTKAFLEELEAKTTSQQDPPDTDAPRITRVDVTPLVNGATFRFHVDELAVVTIHVGTQSQDVGHVEGEVETTFRGFQADTSYGFAITAKDDHGNQSTFPGELRTLSVSTAAPNLARTISQNFTSIRFDRNVAWVESATGFPIIAAGAKVDAIDPSPKYGRESNGVMVSPSSGFAQGFDSEGGKAGARTPAPYNSALNARSQLLAGRVLDAGETLVVGISHPEPRHRPIITYAGVYSFVDDLPRAGAFRRPYSRESAPWIEAHRDDVDFSKIPDLVPAASPWDVAAARRNLGNAWVDYAGSYEQCQYILPSPGNCSKSYGRDLNADLSRAAVVMMDPRTPQQDREWIACAIVQHGIDTAGLYLSGVRWPPLGGLGGGRLFPVLFAGIMLGRQEFIDLTKDPKEWHEKGQTWYVTESDVGRPLNPDNRAAKVLYTSAHVGLPEWGIEHATRPERDNANWGATYRTCCNANSMWGIVALFELLDGGREAVGHDAIFEFQRRYAEEQSKRGHDWQLDYCGTFRTWEAIVE